MRCIHLVVCAAPVTLSRENCFFMRVYFTSVAGREKGLDAVNYWLISASRPSAIRPSWDCKPSGERPFTALVKKKTNFAKIAETACRRHCDDEQFHSQLFSPPMRKSMTPKSPRARIK